MDLMSEMSSKFYNDQNLTEKLKDLPKEKITEPENLNMAWNLKASRKGERAKINFEKKFKIRDDQDY